MRKIKKIMAVTLVMSMLATMLVACGKDETKVDNPADTTNEVVEETTTTPTEDVDVPESEVVEEGTVGDVLDETAEDVEETTEPEIPDTFITSHRFDGGYVDEYQNPDNEEMSDYDVYVKLYDNDVYFSFTGVKGLGEKIIGGNKDGMISLLTKDDAHRLNIWNGEEFSNESDYMKNSSQEDILSWAGVDVDSETYQVDEIDNTYRVIFETSNSPGYVCFVDNFDTNKCYQFTYFERDDIFDDTRIKNTVESIVTSETNFHTP